jgi:hypothetical protein
MLNYRISFPGLKVLEKFYIHRPDLLPGGQLE